jgi:hypothetical protein
MNQPGELDIPLNGITRTLHIIRYGRFLESSNAEQAGILLLENPITTPNIILKANLRALTSIILKKPPKILPSHTNKFPQAHLMRA